MARKFAYYPGCVAEFSSKELNATTKALAPLLDIELLPMPQATCCGAGDIAEAKPNLYLTLNVRILSEAEEMGADILTICNVCTLNLRRANKMVKEDPRLLEQVNGELVNAGARPYQGTIDVTHLLWYLATDAVGLGAFVVVGTSVAIQHGTSLFIAVFMGVISGVGGGVVRDVFTGRVPILFVGQIYGIAGLIGAIVFVVFDHLRTVEPVKVWVPLALVVVLRALAVRYDLHLPRAGGNSETSEGV